MSFNTFMRSDNRHAASQTRRAPALRLTLLGGLLLALAFTGGASSFDAPQQVAARLAAILIIAATLLPLVIPAVKLPARCWWWIGASYGLLLLQLVPLPPGLWAVLPGHAIYADIAVATDTMVWRPISLTPDLTLNALFALLPATAAIAAMLYLREEDWPRVMSWVVLIALVSAALGLMQLAAGDGDALRLYRQSSVDSATGLFANRNHNAYFLSATLPIVAALARHWELRTAHPRLVLPAAAAVALMLSIGLVAAQSRMGLVTGVIGLAASIAIFLRGRRPSRSQGMSPRTILAAGAAMSGAVILVGLMVWRGGLIARFAQTDVAAESRSQMLGPLARSAWAFMPFGSGFGSFDNVYRRFEPLELLSTTYMNQAHNEPLQLAIEGGIPALILLAAFLWWWGKATVATLRQSRPIPLAAAVSTLILMIASLVDYPLRTPLLSAYFAIACMLLGRPDPARTRRPIQGG